MRSDDLLIEIGTEDLPPKSFKTLMSSLANNIATELNHREYCFEAVNAYGSPRRLAVLITKLHELQPEQKIEKRGPSVKTAYADGQPTKALLGFAKSCGVEDLASLDKLATDKGEWIVFREVRRGRSIVEEIESIVAASIRDLPIDRRMRWGSNRAEFVRPVHWAVSLYGKEQLTFNLLGCTTGRVSFGHRFMNPSAIEIDSAESYVDLCRRANVIVEFAERRKIIEDAVTKEASALKCAVDWDQDLLDEVTALVEWPVVLSGSFDESFLEMPEEVLISAMKKHQRYFHLRDAKGKLRARFITVANIESREPSIVVAGNERVIKPRLSDATFFFTSDTKLSLEEQLPRLNKVVFQAELGSYHDKAKRVSILAAFIADQIGGDSSLAARAGLLCKADLVSDMVGEFPDLQGIMGGHYAAKNNEDSEVCDAIRTHYFPTASGAQLPSGPVASSVAIADKLDTVVGIFGIGQPPTGSKDPYALRRQTLGVIRIIIENRLSLDLHACLVKTSEIFQEQRLGDTGKQYYFDITTVYDYILERLNNWYQDSGIDVDVIQAVRNSAVAISNLTEGNERVRALHEFKVSDKAKKLIAANKRVANILKDTNHTDLPEVDTTRFTLEAEHKLFTALTEAQTNLSNTSDYNARLSILADQQEQIDGYFDDVLVMDKNDEVKLNRLATVAQMRQIFLEVADFSLLQAL